MMRNASLGLLSALLAAACGDNEPIPSPETPELCQPPAAVLPAEGPLIDPLALPLAGCAEGGLRDLPGRWFLAAEGAGFTFQYPKFEGSCEAGFRRAGIEDDHDASDGRTLHTWSDGTRMFFREYLRFDIPGFPEPFEFVLATAACLRHNGTMAAVGVQYNDDLGEQRVEMAGKPFGLKDSLATGLTLLGELGEQNGLPMPAYNLVIDGAHAYVIGPLGFDVVDVSNPAAPVHRGHVDGAWNDVRVVRGGGKVVAYASPLGPEPATAIIDATDPANPVQVGAIPAYSHSVQVQERGDQTYLYLANYSEFVPVFDVTNPLVPVPVGMPEVPGPQSGIHDLTVDGDRLYVNYTTEGFVALDVSGGFENAVELGRVPSPYSHASWVGNVGGRPIVLHGDEGMTNAGGAFLTIHDADPSSPTFMREIGRYQSRKEVGIHNFELVGNKAYIAYYQDGVRVVDLSDPTMPREVAHHNTWIEETAPGEPFEGALGIRVVGGKIYVADSLRGLMIFQEQ